MKLRQPHISERCQFQRIIPADEDYKCNVSFAVPVKDFFYAAVSYLTADVHRRMRLSSSFRLLLENNLSHSNNDLS